MGNRTHCCEDWSREGHRKHAKLLPTLSSHAILTFCTLQDSSGKVLKAWSDEESGIDKSKHEEMINFIKGKSFEAMSGGHHIDDLHALTLCSHPMRETE